MKEKITKDMLKDRVYILLYVVTVIFFLILLRCKGVQNSAVVGVDTVYVEKVKPIVKVKPTGEVNQPIFIVEKVPGVIRISEERIRDKEVGISAIEYKKEKLRVQYWQNNRICEAEYSGVTPNFRVAGVNERVIVQSKIEMPKVWLLAGINGDMGVRCGVLVTYRKYGASFSVDVLGVKDRKKYEILFYYRF